MRASPPILHFGRDPQQDARAIRRTMKSQIESLELKIQVRDKYINDIMFERDKYKNLYADKCTEVNLAYSLLRELECKQQPPFGP